MIIQDCLKKALEVGASDIIISPGSYAALKKSGEILYLEEYGKLDGKVLEKEIFSMMSEKFQEKFRLEMELDFSINMSGHGRFRVNGFKQKG